MGNTTILVSEKFHEWLKGKGMKGESYENIIVRVMRREYQQEFKQVIEQFKSQKPKAGKAMPEPRTEMQRTPVQKEPNKGKDLKNKPSKVSRANQPKPTVKPIVARKMPKRPVKPTTNTPKSKNVSKTKPAIKQNKQKNLFKSVDVEIDEELNRWHNEKKLELQRLKTELELAKLSNNAVKINELAISIAKLQKDLEQNM